MATVIEANVTLATNNTPLLFWEWIDFLVTSAGWTQMGSGDGATWSNSGAGPVAGGGVGALGMGDSGSWVRLRKIISGVTYELMFYSGGAAYGSIFVSVDSAFTGGSPSATQRPEATVEEPLLGSGTAASPSHGSPSTGNPAIVQMLCNTSAPYGFVLWSYDSGTKASNHALVMDPLKNMLATRGAPYIFGSGDYTNATDVRTTFFKYRRRHGLSGAAWVSAQMLIHADAMGGVGNDSEDTLKVRNYDIPYYTPGQGGHGDSTLFCVCGTTQSNGTINSEDATGDRMIMGKLVVKDWNNTAAAA